ncbi:hypothetical protein RhiirC2_793285 [Rhizophagus irregularis]|uniref:Uncharacterized protein n=1 Tax=Rhizophagus irregularis TaxID=588596 RepID=A0A2N1MDQ9_9GLOM|nr:hypothetical protein RhiirC2_794325 [Rhizophagus irregularis]PKK60456.1 hypothetical protein RhiirC2_793285 [Rhizophagus irregularis]
MILDESRVKATKTLRSSEKNLSNFDLKVENGKLRADNMELQYKIDKLNKELEESKELNKNLRMPRSMKKSSKPKCKHQKNNDSKDSDDEIIDVDVEIDEKHEKDNKDEKDDKDARLPKALYDKDDVRIAHYEKQEMINIIQDIRYHSLELNEMDKENASEKCQIVMEVLDPYSFTQQNVQLTRRRNYDDTLQNFDVQPLNDAPQWTCVEPGNGNVVYDSDIGYESIYDDYMYNDADTF